MLLDDIIYVCVLLALTFFGPYYRQIKDAEVRQWVATAVGLFASTIVSGWHVLHPIVCTLVNAIIITKMSWKVSHLASLFFSFGYMLFFFRLPWLYGLAESSGHTNLIMMILVLKLSGLAYEINNANQGPEDDIQGVNPPALKAGVSVIDVFHYAFNYAGVLTGPYYRYRTYWDFLHRPFADKADHWKYTGSKLKEAAIYCSTYFLVDYWFHAEYVNREDFVDTSYLYKVFFMYPAFLSFRMRLYTGMLLSECVCYNAGLGAYPSSCSTIYGSGPRNYKCVEELSKSPDKIKPEDLDFETVHNMYPIEMERSHLVRTAMKLWNTCIQYWMAIAIYKRFPSKLFRAPATLTVSAIWHGWAPGYFLTICQVSLYLPMEDVWVKIYDAVPPKSIIRKMMFCSLWFGRVTCQAYLGMSFQLLEFWSSIKYYNSIYWIGHIALVVFYIAGLLIKPYVVPKHSKQGDTKINTTPIAKKVK